MFIGSLSEYSLRSSTNNLFAISYELVNWTKFIRMLEMIYQKRAAASSPMMPWFLEDGEFNYELPEDLNISPLENRGLLFEEPAELNYPERIFCL